MVGDAVLSLAGRDAGKVFLIISSVDDKYVYIADGKLHRAEKPKLKKLKHLKTIKQNAWDGNMSNNAIKRLLSGVRAEKGEECIHV